MNWKENDITILSFSPVGLSANLKQKVMVHLTVVNKIVPPYKCLRHIQQG